MVDRGQAGILNSATPWHLQTITLRWVPPGFRKRHPLTGVVRIYQVDANGINGEPIALGVGESERTESLYGAWLNGGQLNGQPYFLVGANQGQGTGLDNGSVFILPVEPGNQY